MAIRGDAAFLPGLEAVDDINVAAEIRSTRANMVELREHYEPFRVGLALVESKRFEDSRP